MIDESRIEEGWIFWHGFSTEWEKYKRHEGGHDYAWTHPNYRKYDYSLIEIPENLKKFSITPEDKLLDEIFTKT